MVGLYYVAYSNNKEDSNRSLKGPLHGFNLSHHSLSPTIQFMCMYTDAMRRVSHLFSRLLIHNTRKWPRN